MMKPKTIDLTKHFPRSPKEKLGGYVHLARMIDKARAKASGLQGEYIYPCPLDQRLLEFLGVTAEALSSAAVVNEDQPFLEWLHQTRTRWSEEAIEEWNRGFISRKPGDEEGWKRFLNLRQRIAPERQDVMNWVDLLDLDEGREVPIKKTP